MAQELAKTSFARQPLDVVLSRGGAIRVLRALLQHGEPLSVTRIASDTRLTPGGVRAVLNELVETRIVRVVGSGRTQLYYIPSENPFARPLEALFRAETARLSEMLKQVSATAEKAAGGKLTAVWMFGSTARGEDTVASDLDLAVVIDGSEHEVTAIAGEISTDLVTPGEWYGFKPTVVSICLKDIPKLEANGARLWRDLQADGRRIAGMTPDEVLRHIGRERVRA